MKISVTIFLILISGFITAQTNNIIKKANELGDQWKFEEAIALLKKEVIMNPDNAEAYYWLGRYSHYMVYDTRPFPNKNDQWSKEQVLSNFKKAIELNPDFGDAHYFIAVEYGARALEALKEGNIKQYKKEFREAAKYGGFPPHALEFGRNILKSCDTNAILFVDGDAYFNVIQYLQAIEGYRKDVSLVAISLLGRPYYVKLLRDGAKEILKPVPLSINDNLIMEMHNYKWRDNIINIPVPNLIKKKYGLNDTINNLHWDVKPDYGNNVLQSSTAMLINIIETNQWKRPVYFTTFGFDDLFGLNDYIQIVGLTAQLMPIKVKDTKKMYDKEKFENNMLNSSNYKDYNDIRIHNQPRTFFGAYGRYRIVAYTEYLIQNNEKARALTILDQMDKLMPISVYPLSADIKERIDKIRNN